MDACIQYGWPSMSVKPLDTSQKEQIITDYLEGIYGKTLNAEQKRMLVDSEQTNNPLYLKSLLDEVKDLILHEQQTVYMKYEVLSPTKISKEFTKFDVMVAKHKMHSNIKRTSSDDNSAIIRDLVMSRNIKQRPHYQPESFSSRADNGRGFILRAINKTLLDNRFITFSYSLF